MKTETKATEEVYYDENGKRISETWYFIINNAGFVEILDPELREQMSYYRKKAKGNIQNNVKEEYYETINA